MSQNRKDFIKILSAGSAVPFLAASDQSLASAQALPERNATMAGPSRCGAF